MTPADTTDPLFRLLARLPAAIPSAAGQERVQARCHAALAQSQRRHRGLGHRLSVAGLLRAALALVMCLYLSEAVRQAWRLSRAVSE